MKRWVWELIDFAALVACLATAAAFVVLLAAMTDSL